MKLVVKFNLAFIGIFLLGLSATGFISHTLLQSNAREEILQNARIMMQSALATRSYTNAHIKPLLETQMKYNFLPESVPAFAATESFNELRVKFPEYHYKEAALNPSNPRNRAADWEADIVNQLRQDAETTEIIGERETPTGRSLYLAHPIKVSSPTCLQCHGIVDAAPKTMLERYGNANGFGWQLNEIIGAQIVSVPGELALQRASKTITVFMLSLTGVFAFIFLVLNLMLYFIVIRPVTRLSRLADEVSLGNMEAAEFTVKSRDEIGALAGSFDRMRKSLVKAIKMLEE
jgi:protein-histidine pros-kinase